MSAFDWALADQLRCADENLRLSKGNDRAGA
jgi:hypothetical protein